MRYIPKIQSYLFLGIIFLFFTTCELIENNDPCDKTILKPSIEVKVFIKYYLYNGFNEKSDKEVKIVVEKIACGMDEPAPGARFEFTGYMNDDEYFEVGPVGYNLRNENDKINIIFYYMVGDEFEDSAEVTLYPEDFASLTDFVLKFTDEG